MRIRGTLHRKRILTSGLRFRRLKTGVLPADLLSDSKSSSPSESWTWLSLSGV